MDQEGDQQLLVILLQSLVDWKQISLAQQMRLSCYKLHLSPFWCHFNPGHALMDFYPVPPVADDVAVCCHLILKSPLDFMKVFQNLLSYSTFNN